MQVICETCQEPMNVQHNMSTMVGYLSPPGHNHDDNCLTRRYACRNGHTLDVTRRNRCHACGWRGRTTCFCHKGEKSEFWPDEDRETPNV